MKHLTSSNLAELESTLEQARNAVLERVQTQLHERDPDQVRTLTNYFAAGDSRAAAALLSETEIALLQHDAAELASLSAALKRLDFGNYGQCIECGSEIPLARLRAMPDAAACVTCQTRIEGQRGVP